MTTFVFPGQGSQKKGMGADLFEKFSALTAQADRLLGFSIKELCVKDPESKLSQTQYTQPALYVVNALSYLNLIEEGRRRPDFVAGHSLGEYGALFAAGAFDFETGLRLVKKRGELMAQINGGGMAAVVGCDDAKIRTILRDNNLVDIDVANYNAPDQIIISGLKEAIVRAKPVFEAAGSRCALLPVSGAFHSRFMQPVQTEFASFLREFTFGELQIPVISNVEANLYTRERISELLSRQLTHSVRWLDSIRFLVRKGETSFIEVGPGNVLTKLIEKIRHEPPPAEPATLEVSAAVGGRPVEGSGRAVEKKLVTPESWLPRPTNGNGNGHSVGHQIVKPSSTAALYGITASALGDENFKRDYGLKYAYVASGINSGISSTGFVLRLARAGLLGYFGAGGLRLSQIEAVLQEIQSQLREDQPYGVSLVCDIDDPRVEEETVDLLLKEGVKNVEASAYIQITPALVRYRLKGLSEEPDGTVVCRNRVLAKVTHPEVAEAFLSPAPERLVSRLLSEKRITQREAELAVKVPLANDLCLEADSDQRAAHVLLPVILKFKNERAATYQRAHKVRVGIADGIGTPAAIASAFFLGADFVMTASLNQCTVEANLSESAKDMLELMLPQDTEYAPRREMFEMGAKVCVLKKGLLFPARANRLYDLYRRYNSWEEIDERVRRQVQERYFRRSFAEVYAGIKASTSSVEPKQIEDAERNPKQKMALVFKWYLDFTRQLAASGDEKRRVDYQIQCEPALGAFNHWVKGTSLEKWRSRHVDEIAEKLMNGAAEFANQRFQALVERG